MTLQDLKDNKEEIVSIIIEKVGAENLSTVMQQMINGLDCCDSLEELLESAIYMPTQHEVKIEKSAIAALLGKIAELDN